MLTSLAGARLYFLPTAQAMLTYRILADHGTRPSVNNTASSHVQEVVVKLLEGPLGVYLATFAEDRCLVLVGKPAKKTWSTGEKVVRSVAVEAPA